MKMKTLRVGVMSKAEYKKRTIAIAKGEYTPKKNEPKVWFESLNSMGQILGSENQELLRLIIENKPKSLTELEEISGRKKSNLSRTLKTLERYGIVEFEREGKNIAPKVLATDFHVEFGIKSVA
jgi:predicted transcriptional regulator